MKPSIASIGRWKLSITIVFLIFFTETACFSHEKKLRLRCRPTVNRPATYRSLSCTKRPYFCSCRSVFDLPGNLDKKYLLPVRCSSFLLKNSHAIVEIVNNFVKKRLRISGRITLKKN